jgi:hypothetical protein
MILEESGNIISSRVSLASTLCTQGLFLPLLQVHFEQVCLVWRILLMGTDGDMTTSTNNMLQPPSQATPTPVQVFDGPITRSRAKKLQQEVHALLSENHFNVNENYILPKSCTLLLLRCTTEDDKKTPRVDQRGGSCSSQSSMTEPSERISHHF